jgi:hypothetical protein
VSTIATNLCIGIATAFAGAFGPAAIAGYGTASRLEYLLVPLVFGIGGPLLAMVGTCIGAGQRERALRATWVGAAMAFVLTEAIGLAAALFPRPWLALFDSDPAMIEAGARYLQVVGPFYGFFGWGWCCTLRRRARASCCGRWWATAARLAVAAAGGWLALRWGGRPDHRVCGAGRGHGGVWRRQCMVGGRRRLVWPAWLAAHAGGAGGAALMTAATAREVLDDRGGSWYGKSTLLISLLRLCHIPARLRMVRLGPQHWRGLVMTTKPVNHPMVEIWLGERWQRTDTHVYDLRYMAAARAQLHRKGWQVGYGVHRNGDTIWNGREDAFATFVLDEPDGGPRADLGVYNDPMEFMRWLGDQAPVAGVRRAMHWGLVAARINHSVQALRKTRASQAALA